MTKAPRQFLCEVQYLKGGKFWVPVCTVVLPASSVVVAVGKAARKGKKILPKGTRNPGMLVKATPMTPHKEDA